MIDMSKRHSIRTRRRNGEKIAEIARNEGVCRNTVYKVLGEDDYSPAVPVRGRRPRMLDPYRRVIEGWLDEDGLTWRKQRHTAHRVWERLRDELGVECSESTARHYVAELRRERRAAAADPAAGYADLEWDPGEAQADFGEADFYLGGVRVRRSYFVLSFPYSNMGFAQVFASENAECVCQGLKQVFEHVGGVPRRIVFDNATGVGRRVCGGVRTTKTFGAFAAHYGFEFAFCNPGAGHEKGNVEGKVKYVRSELFVPVPQVASMRAYNARLLGRCDGLSKDHYLKGEPEAQLFMEDRLAMCGLPQRPFDVVRYERRKADKQGKVVVDGNHRYATDPMFAGREMVVGLGATDVRIYDGAGSLVCEYERAYGDAPTDTTNPASQLALLALRPGAWRNSQVRRAIPEDLAAYMDGLGEPDLKEGLRVMRNASHAFGWDAAVDAVGASVRLTGRIDGAGVELIAACGGREPLSYDEPVDLAAYDRLVSEGEAGL